MHAARTHTYMVEMILFAAVVLNRTESICYGLMTYPNIKCNLKWNAMSKSVDNSSTCKLVLEDCTNSESHGAHIHDVNLRLNHLYEGKMESPMECNVQTVENSSTRKLMRTDLS